MTSIDTEKLSLLESKIQNQFNDKNLLRLTLIHRSFLNENPDEAESNERLEFLGDAILEFIVSDQLFKKFPSEDEGHLTVLRSRLVNTEALAELALSLSLGDMLYLSKGEEKGGGRNSNSLLADTVEAIIGGIYLDQGLENATKFIETFVLSRIHDVVKKSLKDPKSLLQEYVQANGLPAPLYKTISEEGPDHAKNFTVSVYIDKQPYAEGTGSSKQVAAQNAAQMALEKWSKSEES